MKRIFLLAGVSAMLVMSSCKKDKNSDSDSGNGNGTKTKLLKKVTRTENGATTVLSFNYDGSKLTSYSSADNLESAAFTFDGSGNIVKAEIRDHNEYSTYTYSYNNGVPVSGTLKTWLKVAGEPDDLTEDDVFTYTVVNNQVTKIKQQMKVDDEELVVNLTYNSNGNLEKVQSEGEGEDVFTISFKYGTKKPGFPTMLKYVLDLGLSLQLHAKNELLTATYDFPGILGDFTINTQYTYDADGYPLTSKDEDTQLKFEYQ
jgi:hypothetical protein